MKTELNTPAALFPQRDICRERARICGLTRREIQVAREMIMGKTNDEIARELGLSAHTIRTHVERVLAKVQVRTRTGAVAMLASFERPDAGNTSHLTFIRKNRSSNGRGKLEESIRFAPPHLP